MKTLNQKQRGFSPDSSTVSKALTDGALSELYLTPKPGLVDRLDNGSHPDLDLETMEASISLLPVYYSELTDACLSGAETAEMRRIGVRAEERMLIECGSNTHKGYIFLSGLVLISSILYSDLREGIRLLSLEFFKDILPESNGSQARKAYKSGGIVSECLLGMPSVFDFGLKAVRMRPEDEGLYALAHIMENSDDTTSLHRCGVEGLKTVRADGAALRFMIENNDDYISWLIERNSYYKSVKLTMGGCADMLALTYALRSLGY